MRLEIKDLLIEINRQPIVQIQDLVVADKQFVGLIGANGSGKTTLLKSIYRAVPVQKGHITIDGMDLLALSQKVLAQRVAVVGQFNQLAFDLTVEEIVLLGRTPHKRLLEADKLADYQLVDRLIQTCHLEDLRNRSYLSLSGGEKQRVILARALAQEPQLLILDEPTNHLDVRYQLEILSIVKSLDISVLAVLHDLETTSRMCDYIYALKAGEVISQGKPEQVLTNDLVETIYGVTCTRYLNPVDQQLGFYYALTNQNKKWKVTYEEKYLKNCCGIDGGLFSRVWSSIRR